MAPFPCHIYLYLSPCPLLYCLVGESLRGIDKQFQINPLQSGTLFIAFFSNGEAKDYYIQNLFTLRFFLFSRNNRWRWADSKGGAFFWIPRAAFLWQALYIHYSHPAKRNLGSPSSVSLSTCNGTFGSQKHLSAHSMVMATPKITECGKTLTYSLT